MSEDFGPTFITVTDEDGKELVLEFVDALEYNGQMYQAFFPAETEGENEDDPDNGLVTDPRGWRGSALQAGLRRGAGGGLRAVHGAAV